MGSKKKKKDKVKKIKDKSKIDERVKQIGSIQPPDLTQEFKLDNEKNIDRFMKFGFIRPKPRLNIKVAKSMSRSGNRNGRR